MLGFTEWNLKKKRYWRYDMSLKEFIVFTILMTFTIFFAVTVIKTTLKKDRDNKRIIEQIDRDYDKKVGR